MIHWLKNWKKKQDFFPDFSGILIQPYFFARRGLYLKMRELAPKLKGKLLDVGCGRKPYQNLFKVDSYIGMDIELSGHSHEQEDVDVFYDGTIFPFENETFDSILCNQVLEHVFNPDEFLSEIQRVLKKDGQFLLTVPFCWDEHEQPYDFARYSSFGLKHLFEKHGFEIIKHEKSVTGFKAVSQLFTGSLFKWIYSKNVIFNMLFTLFFIFPIHLLVIIFSFIFPKNTDLYLDNIVLAKKK